jgi:hypothetical protein
MANGDIAKNIDQRNHEAEEMLPIWQKCEDCREGQTAIHKAGELYLPRLSGQDDKEYSAYKRRAVFYGAMSRTVDAFQGMVMRVPPNIDKPNPLLDDVDAAGNSLYEFADDLLEDALVKNFGGILVEHTPQREGVRTAADAMAAGLRPYLTRFSAGNIINWKKSKGIFSQVILKECESVSVSEFESKERHFYRVLDIDAAGFYRQRKFIQSEKDKQQFIQEGDDIYPTKGNAKLTMIPFYFIGDVECLPPFIDLVDLNISHYQSTADLENGAHFTGIPQPWIAGVQLDDGETLKVGGTSAWVFPDPQAKAEYLEFTGQGLATLEKRLETKEKQMAAIGARMLSDTVTAETATGAGIRSSGEFSVLAQLAGNISKVLTRACSFMLEWAGASAVNIKLNTDYLPAKMTPQELQALVGAWQSGAISSQTFFYNLQQGEIIAQDVDFDDEQENIQSGGPALGLMTVE